MNFIYIHTHDSGRYIEPYGIAADNPSLTALAHEGTIFRNMYCCAPTCSPSRAAMLTGQTPHNCGMLGLAHRGFALERPNDHLANYLRSNGYHTALFGVQHEAVKEDVNKLGYCDIVNKQGKNSVETDFNNLLCVREFLNGSKKFDKPFFVSFGLNNTHKPWPKSKGFESEYVMPPFPIVDTPETREEYCNYLESLSAVDRCVGGVIDALKQNEIWDDTIILFTTDHGLALPNMKCNLYDTGIGVSFILRIPGRTRGVCDALCSQIDMYPTICELLGLEKPEFLQGRSMLPLLDNIVDEINDFVFSEVTFHATYQPMRSVRSKQYKLIRFYDGANEARPANIDAGKAKDIYLDTKYFHKTKPKEFFFDLYADPTERINFAEDPAYLNEYNRHIKALEEWQRRTDDPIIKGATMVDMGRGKRTNAFDDRDPNPKASFIIGE
ncbi:MAG: sulfatase [Ruminococcaceae bacterium]|nr:sulfatase [Oscillospiraceae bacterium]